MAASLTDRENPFEFPFRRIRISQILALGQEAGGKIAAKGYGGNCSGECLVRGGGRGRIFPALQALGFQACLLKAEEKKKQ